MPLPGPGGPTWGPRPRANTPRVDPYDMTEPEPVVGLSRLEGHLENYGLGCAAVAPAWFGSAR